MRKIFIILVLMTCGITGAWADEVSEEEALELAQQFVSGLDTRKSAPSSRKVRKSVPTVMAAGQVYGLYVFNVTENRGFVVVSNDDQTTPILGFGKNCNIDIDNLPDNMRYWLQGYADQIAWLRTQDTQTSGARQKKAPKRVGSHPTAAIGPLVTTHWDQDAPYNNLCPKIGVERTVTGCVATTMAQLMYYHYAQNHFSAASTVIPEYTTRTKSLRIDALSATGFAWGDMTTTYGKESSTDAKSAVATLMQYCGAALQMDYDLASNGGSSSYNEAIPFALKTYFGYDGGIRHCYRKNYSYDTWVDLIYSELANNRPVALGGQSCGGGHSFICDGYKYQDDTDYFHINWGWGGSSDEYYVLSVLQPWEQGIGGSSTLDGFSFGQDAVIGIQKPVDDNVDYCMSLERLDLGGSDATKMFTRTASTDPFTGISLYYVVYDYYYGSNAFDTAVQLVDGTGQVVQTLGRTENQTKTWNQTISATLSNLSILSGVDNGTYYVKVMSKLHGDTNWQECYDGDAYKLTATVSDNNLTINVPIPANVNPKSVTLTFPDTNDYMTGHEQTVTATITGGTGNYNGDVVLRVNGTAIMGQVVNIPAGESETLTFKFIPKKCGSNTIALYDSRSGGSPIGLSQSVNIAFVLDNSVNNTSIIDANHDTKTDAKLYGRTLYKDGKWNTLCLPFNVTIAGSPLAGAEARTLNDASISGTTLTLNFSDPVTTLVAGTPYIIKWEKAEGYDSAPVATRDIKDPEFADVTIDKTRRNVTSTGASFKGCYFYNSFAGENTSILFLGDNNNLYYPLAGATLGAMRAYFSLSDPEKGGSSVREFRLNFGEDSEVSGISGVKEVREVKEVRDNTWFTLDGRRLNGRPTAKGIYVRNGKTIVIK